MSEIAIDFADAEDFKTFSPVDGQTDITIDAHHTGTYWNVQSTKEATRNEATQIIQKIFPMDSTIHGVIIINKVSITTACGKKDKGMLTTIGISRDTYNKISVKFRL